MHTAITLGKIFICMVCMGLASPAFAGFPPICDFEDKMLGELPTDMGGIQGGWGAPNDGKFIYVTNRQGCNSEKSMMVKIQPNVGGMFGINFPVKWGDPNEGVLMVELDFYKETPAFHFMAEFRCRDGKIGIFDLGSHINFYRAGKVGPHLKTFRWYHLTFRLPLTEADGICGSMTLKDWKTGEEWKQEYTSDPLRLRHPDSDIGLVINFYPHYFGSIGILYLDNIKSSIDPNGL